LISANALNRLRKIFKNNNWVNDDNFDEYSDIFVNYCNLLKLLSTEEQNLIMALSEEFNHYPDYKYHSLITKTVNSIDSTYFVDTKKVFLLSLKKPSDINKVKSSTGLLYFTRPKILKLHPTMTVECIDIIDNLKVRKRNNALLIFMDDFVGTGDTALEALQYYRDNLVADGDRVILLSLISLKTGLDSITANGYKVFTTTVLGKGISDSTKITDKNAAFDIMRNIEEKLDVSVIFKNGYKGSEALVSMTRTPNNTFPVFWAPKTIEKMEWPAPFIRR